MEEQIGHRKVVLLKPFAIFGEVSIDYDSGMVTVVTDYGDSVTVPLSNLLSIENADKYRSQV